VEIPTAWENKDCSNFNLFLIIKFIFMYKLTS
jgi:hypothetical protein